MYERPMLCAILLIFVSSFCFNRAEEICEKAIDHMKNSLRNDNYSRNFLNRIESRQDFEINSTETLIDQIFEVRAFIARVYISREGLLKSLEGNWLHMIEKLNTWLEMVRLDENDSDIDTLQEWKALIDKLYEEGFGHLILLAKLSISDLA